MTHDEIQNKEIAESYLRGRLTEADSAAFEDHCFACDECFANLENLQNFAVGVRDAVETGKLPEAKPASAPWLMQAFFAVCALCLLLGIATGVLLDEARSKGAAANRRIAELEKQVEETRLMAARGPEANLPLLMLEATRAASPNAVTLPAGAQQLALWVEPPPSANTQYRLELVLDGQIVQTMEGLTRNSYGALAVSLPASNLRAGEYRARIYSMQPRPALAGEYRFQLRK